MELEHLVPAAATGDERAWKLLVDRLWPRLKGFFVLRCSNLDVHDLVQDTFVVIFGKLPDFQMRSEAEFLAWVDKIALLMALTAYRQAQRFHQSKPVLGQMTQPLSKRLSSEFARAERLEIVRREADKLPQSYRRAVHVMLDGGDAKDLAELTGIQRNSARSLMSEAIKRLRRRLQLPTPQS